MSIATELTRIQEAKANLKASLEAKGVTVSSSATLDAYPALVDSIPSGGGSSRYVIRKDVMFYDYDGTRLSSFTKDEFLALTNLPAGPNHEDESLIFDGWTYNLADAKAYVQDCGGLDLGALYHTADNKSHMFVEMANTLTIQLFFGTYSSNNTNAYFDWGDGTSNQYLNINGSKNISHTYSVPGYYHIVFYCDPINTMVLGYLNAPFIYNSNYYDSSKNTGKYVWEVKKLFLNNVQLNSQAIYNSGIEGLILGNLTYINDNHIAGVNNFGGLCYRDITTSIDIPGDASSYIKIICVTKGSVIKDGDIGNNTYLESFCFPEATTSIRINNCSRLLRVCIPTGVTTLKDNAFSNCYSLNEIVIPSTVTSIGDNAFKYCLSLDSLTIKATNPPTLGSNSFNNTPNNLVIYVPASAVEDYKAASGWSTYASKIQAIPSE